MPKFTVRYRPIYIECVEFYRMEHRIFISPGRRIYSVHTHKLSTSIQLVHKRWVRNITSIAGFLLLTSKLKKKKKQFPAKSVSLLLVVSC